MNEATIIEVKNKNHINNCSICGFCYHNGVILIAEGSSFFICSDCFERCNNEALEVKNETI